MATPQDKAHDTHAPKHDTFIYSRKYKRHHPISMAHLFQTYLTVCQLPVWSHKSYNGSAITRLGKHAISSQNITLFSFVFKKKKREAILEFRHNQ
jgi:hypothetical protein